MFFLETPETIRAPREEEVPGKNPSVLQALKKRETANIVEGYVLSDNDPDSEYHFKFYAEININNSRLWSLTKRLLLEFPEEVSIIFGNPEEEHVHGKYTDKQKLIDFLEAYSKQVIANTMLDVGFIYNNDNMLLEIMIDSAKFVKFWGVDKSSFLSAMDDFELREIENLEFVDQYPTVREALNVIDDSQMSTYEFTELLKNRYVD